MNIIAINGSPRKTNNTATVLQHVLDGAQSAATAGMAGDGNDTVKIWGVTETGSDRNALNNWAGLVFKKDGFGGVQMSFDGGANALTFFSVQGTDNLGFYNTAGDAAANRLFGGDVNLTQLYTFVTSNTGFNDNDWHGVNFTGTGTYTASAVKT